MTMRAITLHVFISSPGDCAEERAALREIVRRVSASDPARAAGIELQPLMWEDLPPGQAEAGDLQSRVNALLDRYGLKKYEIYAGAMKDRLGTPTAKFRSGTIEELESAIAGHRRAQVPAEVLFYFVGAGTDEVRAFREELNARGFLFADVPDRERLEERFEAHLTRIVTEWWRWRNRLRRAFRSARSATAIAAAILLLVALVAYWTLDRGGARRVDDALRTGGPVAALAAYEREAPYLVVHKAFAKRELRDAVVAAIDRSVLEDGSARDAAALWQRATRAEIWVPDEPDARRLLRSVAARRLLEALLADGVDVGQFSQRCRPFEIEALRELARNAARSPALAKWPRAQHIAACVLAEAWPQLAAIPGDDAKVAMVRFAPPHVAARWIAATVSKSTADPEVHDMILAAEDRGDPAVISALLERLQEGAIDRSVHREDVLRAVEALDRKKFAPYAIQHLARIVRGGPSDAEVFPVLFSFAPPSAPDVMVDALIRPVAGGKASADYEIAVYRAIAQRREARARNFLLRQYEAYRSERMSYGFAQKAALIDALAATNSMDAPERALALATIAHREAEERGIDDWIVQAAYLRALAGNVAAWPRHASYVRESFARRAGADLTLMPDGFDSAAIELLEKLTPAQVIALLALPAGIVSDELEGKWEVRWYVLRALAEARPVDDAIAEEIFAHLPVDDDLRMRVVRAVSRRGGKVARIFLAREFLRDRTGNRGYLDVLADLGEQQFFLERMGEGADDAIFEAAARLPEASRCPVFRRAVQRFAATHARRLWIDAGRCRIGDDVLAQAAVGELRKGDAAAAVAPLKYLVAIGRERQVLGDVTRLLRAADPFDWIALAQQLPERSARDSSIEALLDEQARLVVTDSAEPGSFSAGGRGVSNPLLAAYASRADAAGARKLLHWASGGKPVEVLGRAEDAPVLYRAYCLWLAAAGVRGMPATAIASEFEVTSLLTENNAPLVRAAAAVCLESPANRQPPTANR